MKRNNHDQVGGDEKLKAPPPDPGTRRKEASGGKPKTHHFLHQTNEEKMKNLTIKKSVGREDQIERRERKDRGLNKRCSRDS